MENIRIECSNGFTLETRGANLIVSRKKEEESIPINKIQSFTLKKPGLVYGKIIFKTAQAASGGVALGFGISAAIGADREFFYLKGDFNKAEALRDYITTYSESPVQPKTEEKTCVSVVEEIRGLKRLLDDGILTQEEFDAKKKQLLGI